MSLASAFGGAYQFTTEDGRPMSVKKLTMNQLADIAAKLETIRDDRLAARAKAQGLNAMQAAQFIESSTLSEEIDVYAIRGYAATIKGAEFILPMVLDAAVIDTLHLADRAHAAMGACGWNPPPAAAGDAANPSSAGAPSDGPKTAG